MTGVEDTAALRALARGAYADWHGLPAGLPRAVLDEALGGPDTAQDQSGRLAGMPATYRIYPPAEGAPFGVQAWFAGDVVATLEIREPPLTAPLDELLGEPDTRVPSGLGGSYTQWVYAGRGLAVHVNRISGQALRLYAFPACPVDTFLAHPLSRVERRRIPRPGA
jgi:hypothetical protein